MTLTKWQELSVVLLTIWLPRSAMVLPMISKLTSGQWESSSTNLPPSGNLSIVISF